jgi:hypothetical protein
LGGFLTIIAITLLIAAAWNEGNDLFYKVKPTVNLENRFFTNTPKLNLNRYSCPFAVTFQDYNQVSFTDPRFFKYNVGAITTSNLDYSSKYEEAELIKCEEHHFPNFSSEYFKQTGLGAYMCVKDQNFTIGGGFGEETISYLILKMGACVNTTEKADCAPLDEIKSFIRSHETSIAWNMYMQNSVVNTQNYANPLSYYLLNLYKNANLNAYKTYSVYLHQQEIITDNGILFQNLESMSAISFDSDQYDDAEGVETKPYVEIFVHAAGSRIIHRRQYVKVPVILAGVGGLTKFFMVCGYLLNYYFSVYKRNTKILNKIYEFEVEHQQKLNQTSKSYFANNLTTNKLSRPPLTNNMLKIESQFPVGINLDNSKTQNIIDTIKERDKNSKFKFSFSEVMRILVCCCCIKGSLRKKMILYRKEEGMISECLDLGEITDKLEELEKMKIVLFNPEQAAMLKFISKAYCGTEDSSKANSNISVHKNVMKDEKKLIQSVLNYEKKLLSGDAKVSELDSRIFANLKESVKDKLVGFGNLVNIN